MTLLQSSDVFIPFNNKVKTLIVFRIGVRSIIAITIDWNKTSLTSQNENSWHLLTSVQLYQSNSIIAFIFTSEAPRKTTHKDKHQVSKAHCTITTALIQWSASGPLPVTLQTDQPDQIASFFHLIAKLARSQQVTLHVEPSLYTLSRITKELGTASNTSTSTP